MFLLFAKVREESGGGGGRGGGGGKGAYLRGELV